MRRQSQNETELKRATELKNGHMRDVREARRVVQDLRQLSLSFPSDHLFVQIDGRIPECNVVKKARSLDLVIVEKYCMCNL